MYYKCWAHDNGLKVFCSMCMFIGRLCDKFCGMKVTLSYFVEIIHFFSRTRREFTKVTTYL